MFMDDDLKEYLRLFRAYSKIYTCKTILVLLYPVDYLAFDFLIFYEDMLMKVNNEYKRLKLKNGTL